MRRPTLLATMLLLSLLLAGCTSEIDKPVRSDRIEGAPEVPKNLQTLVGDGEVVLRWTVSDRAKISMFLIYRGDTAQAEPQLIDSTAELSFTDTDLRNGLRYIYQVSAVGVNGLEGKPSLAVSATPNTFAISIADGAKYVNSINVTVNLTASSGTRLVMLANDSLFTGSTWASFTAAKSWRLEPGDGRRDVYARFRDIEGNETARFVRDDITVDTRAGITSITENSGGRILTVGSIIHFALDAGETDGVATADVTSLGTVNLYDDPIIDGIYEADFTVPGAVDVLNGTVTGNFTDAAGNRALSRAAATRVNIANPPAASTLTNYIVSETEVELNWTRSTADDFASYLLFRSESGTVDSLSTLVKTETSAATTTYRDTDVKVSTAYYYALYAVDRSGLMSKSNVIRVATSPLPPAAVVLTGYVVSESEIELSWTRSNASDFASYELFRSDDADVTASSTLLQTQAAVGTTTFRDTDRTPATDYYYAVFTADKSGLMSRSNVVKVTTATNQPPEPVSIFITKQDSTSISIGWTKNNDEDFESYRVYRSANPGVAPSTANLTGVVTAQGTTQYTDVNIDKGQRFYFIVVVYDKYGAPSAASNEVFGPNP